MCQCDPACTFFGDCCVDYIEYCQPTSANYTPSTGLRLENLICYVEVPRADINQGYYVISSCPLDSPTRQDDLIRHHCEHVDDTDFLSRIMVSGLKNDIPYFNVYCALCWGETIPNLVSWTVGIICGSDSKDAEAAALLSNSTSKETLHLIEHVLECLIVFKHPAMAAADLRTCFHGNEYIDHCLPGNSLHAACEFYTAVSIFSDFPFYIPAKNPHCVECNERSFAAINCSTYYPFIIYMGFLLQDPPSVPTTIPPPLSIIFDFRSGGNVKVVTGKEVVITEEHVTCPANHVYDPFQSECRRLSCGKGYVFDGYQCVRNVTPFVPMPHDTVIYVHITACELTIPEPGPSNLVSVKMCLGELIGVNQSDFQPSQMTPTLTDINCLSPTQPVVYPFMVWTDWETFLAFNLKLQIIDSWTLCPDVIILSVEVIYHSVNLSLHRCNGHWIDKSHLYQNQSSWISSTYIISQSLHRETFNSQSASHKFEWSYSIQICENPDLSCVLETFNRSLFHTSANNDSSLTYIPTGEAFLREQYIETSSGEIQVCSFNEQNGTRNRTQIFTFFEYSPPQQILSIIGNSVSMLASVITFLSFCFFKELRHRTTCPIMNLVGALFLAQLFFQLIGVGAQHPAACTAVAVLTHYLFLVSVMWTGVLAFNLNRTFAVQSRIQHSKHYALLVPVLFAWGVPLLIILPCLILHLCDCTAIPLWYGDSVCWIGNGYVAIAVFGVPIGIVIFTNTILFAFTVRGIWRTKRATEAVRGDKSKAQQAKEELAIYIKISSLMGFTWISGFAAAISDVVALWYVFIVLNSCQGLLIFLSFVCNRKVWQLWCDGFRKMCPHSWRPLPGEGDTGTVDTGHNPKTVQLRTFKSTD
ncbi:uncharacterized protein LOC119724692 [Patiria miniata]|uniref:G-protein coupled receptors family 2 profile 2 domain-containing protein n=1 Tax=Patiria miniata TaxID=46514 RepID=A0A913ZL66_PATMI|nr:uncharacterized protein LOC119724692 [Patiria miniata]